MHSRKLAQPAADERRDQRRDAATCPDARQRRGERPLLGLLAVRPGRGAQRHCEVDDCVDQRERLRRALGLRQHLAAGTDRLERAREAHASHEARDRRTGMRGVRLDDRLQLGVAAGELGRARPHERQQRADLVVAADEIGHAAIAARDQRLYAQPDELREGDPPVGRRVAGAQLIDPGLVEREAIRAVVDQRDVAQDVLSGAQNRQVGATAVP